MRPTFDAALIADLRQRVIQHNEANPTAKVRLGELRKVYEKNFRRSNPGARAMHHVDRQLAELAKSDTFDPDKHPRTEGGRFASGGASGQKPTRVVSMPLPATKQEHQQLQVQNAGYKAITTDVIPETRYEAVGGLVRIGGSLAAGTALVGLLARARPGGASEQALGRAFGAVGRMGWGAAGSAVGNAAVRAARAVRLKRPDAKDAKDFTRIVAEAGDLTGQGMGQRTHRRLASLVQSPLRPAAGDGELHPRAERLFNHTVAHLKDMGFSDAAAKQAALPAAVRLDAKLDRRRRRLVFAAMSGAAGLGIRHAIKDTIVDPVEIGRSIDEFSFRAIKKRAADTPELGLAYRRYTDVLAKGTQAGGSIESLGQWLTEGGGSDAELRKAVPLPWGRAAVRVFTGGAVLAGAAGGAAAAYGGSKALQVKQRGEQFDEEAHPRANDGKFTSKSGRDRRAAQVGAILGGAGAGIAVAALLGRRNAKVQSMAVAALQRRGAEELTQIRAYKLGAAKKAVDGAPARIKAMIEAGDEFKGHRDQIARIRTLGASDPTVVQTRLQRAYHERLTDMLAPNADLMLPYKGGFRSVRDFVTAGAPAARRLEMQRHATMDALGRMTRDEFKTATEKLSAVDKNDALKLFDEGVTAVKNVPAQMMGHKGAVEAAQAHVLDLKTKEVAAKDAVDHARNQMIIATDGAPKEAATAAHAEALKIHTKAIADHKKAATAASKLQNNPSGVTDPFTGENIQPPTEADLEQRLRTLNSAATVKATKIVTAETNTVMRAQEAAYLRRHDFKLAIQAVRGVENGAPRNARNATKALADLFQETKDARAKLRVAALNHAPNEKELADLQLATKTTKATKTQLGGKLIDPPAKVMSAERVQDLRTREDEIIEAHTGTADKLKAAQDAFSAVQVKRDAATAVFHEAMDVAAPAPAGKKPGILSPEARRDLERVKSGLSGAWKDFSTAPSTKKLMALTNEARAGIKTGAKRAKAKLKTAGKRVYEDSLTRDNGKGGRELSPAKVVSAGSLAAGAIGAAKTDLLTLKDRYFGSDEAKAQARGRSARTQFEQRIDPETGAGYYAISIADPKKKNQRTVVWAERFDSVHGKATPIVGGGPLSDLEGAMKARELARKQAKFAPPAQQGRGALRSMMGLAPDKAQAANEQLNVLRSAGKLQSLGTFAGGPSLELAADDHNSGAVNEAAGAVINHLAGHFGTARATPTGEELHKTLDALFSTEGRTLTAKQVYRELTGYKDNGEKNKRMSILAPNQAYAAQGANDPNIGTALAANLTTIGKHAPPQNIQQTEQLHRAVAVIGHVKKLAPSTLDALHQKIRSMGPQSHTGEGAPVAPETVAAATQQAPSNPVPAPEAMARSNPQPPRAVPIDLSRPAPEGSTRYNAAVAQTQAIKHAHTLGERLDFEHSSQYEALAGAINGFARIVTNHYHLSEHHAVDAVAQTLHDMMQTDGDTEDLKRMLGSIGGVKRILEDRKFREHLAANAEDLGGTLKKSILLDDLDSLLKLSMGEFVESLHPRAPAGAIDGGEFIASAHGQGGVGTRVAGEVAEAGGKHASTPAAAAAGDQHWAHPVRLGNELGGALGYETAFNVASRVLPAGIGTIGRFAAETALGMAGATAGGEAGNAIGQAVDRAQTGKKRAVEYQPPEDKSIGQGLAGIGGAMAGGMWGNTAGAAAGALAGRAIGGTLGALGGPLGAIALGTAAGYAGEKLGGGLYGYFAGYDEPAVQRAMNRFAPRGRFAGNAG